MKRMKKWLAFALTAVMLFTGCGTKDTADTDTTQTATESPGTSREASGVPCLNPRRGLTLLSPVCRDPAIGV